MVTGVHTFDLPISLSKAPPDLRPLSKPSLPGGDSAFIDSVVEETEALINRKYRNSLRSL
jgi:hypothetical protein